MLGEYVFFIVKISKLYLIILFCYSPLHGVTLQSIFDESGPGNGYDKYVILEQDMIYTGEVGIYEGDVFIGISSSGSSKDIPTFSHCSIYIY